MSINIYPIYFVEIIRNAIPGTTTKAAEDRIADWLRRGGDRLKAATTKGRNSAAKHRECVPQQ